MFLIAVAAAWLNAVVLWMQTSGFGTLTELSDLVAHLCVTSGIASRGQSAVIIGGHPMNALITNVVKVVQL